MVAGVAAMHRFENIRKTFLRELLPRNLLLTLAAIASTVFNFPQSFHWAYRLVDAEQTFPSRSSNRSSRIVTVDYSSFSFFFQSAILRKVEPGFFIIRLFRPPFVFGRISSENSRLFEKFSSQRTEHPVSKYENISRFPFFVSHLYFSRYSDFPVLFDTRSINSLPRDDFALRHLLSDAIEEPGACLSFTLIHERDPVICYSSRDVKRSI